MDGNRLTIKGAVGELRWGYSPAASLSSWAIATDSAGVMRLTATVIQQDAFRASQRPLTFVVPRPTGAWTWTIHSLQIAGSTLVASINPQE